MPTKPKQNNILLIVLIVVAALFAVLLLLDTFLPILPDSIDRRPASNGADTDPSEDAVGGTAPPVSLDTDIILDGLYDVTFNGVIPFYTEEELTEMYREPLATALYRLAELEAAGEILPIDRVGFFNADVSGNPEVIVMRIRDGVVEYVAYELFSLEELTSWSWEGTQYGELSLWMWHMYSAKISSVGNLRGSMRSIITHTGDGDDECLYEIDSQWVCEELFAKVSEAVPHYEGMSLVQYRLGGEVTDSDTYAEVYERFRTSNSRLTDTTMVTVEWTPYSPEGMAEKILSSGQLFPYTGK